MQYGDLLSQVLDFSAAGSKAQTECGLNSFLRSEVALLNNIVDSNFRNHKLGSAEQKSGLVNIQNFAAFLNTDEAKKKSEVPGLKSHNQVLFSFLRRNHTILKSDEMTCPPPAAKQRRKDEGPPATSSTGSSTPPLASIYSTAVSASSSVDSTTSTSECHSLPQSSTLLCPEDDVPLTPRSPSDSESSSSSSEEESSSSSSSDQAPGEEPVEEPLGVVNIVGVKNSVLFGALAAVNKSDIFLGCAETMSKAINYITNHSTTLKGCCEPAITVVDEAHLLTSRLVDTEKWRENKFRYKALSVPEEVGKVKNWPYPMKKILPKKIAKVFLAWLSNEIIKFCEEDEYTNLAHVDENVRSLLDKQDNSLISVVNNFKFDDKNDGRRLFKFLKGQDFINYWDMTLMKHFVMHADPNSEPVNLDYTSLKQVCDPECETALDDIEKAKNDIVPSDKGAMDKLVALAEKARKTLEGLPTKDTDCAAIKCFENKFNPYKPNLVQRAYFEASSKYSLEKYEDVQSLLVEMPPGMGKTLCASVDCLTKRKEGKIFVIAPQRNHVVNFATTLAQGCREGAGVEPPARVLYMLEDVALETKKFLETKDEKGRPLARVKYTSLSQTDDKNVDNLVKVETSSNRSKTNKNKNKEVDVVKFPDSWSYMFLSATPYNISPYHRMAYNIKTISAKVDFLCSIGSILYPKIQYLSKARKAPSHILREILHRARLAGCKVLSFTKRHKMIIAKVAETVAECLKKTNESRKNTKVSPLQQVWGFVRNNQEAHICKIAAEVFGNTEIGRECLRSRMKEADRHLVKNVPFVSATSTLEDGKTNNTHINSVIQMQRQYGETWGTAGLPAAPPGFAESFPGGCEVDEEQIYIVAIFCQKLLNTGVDCTKLHAVLIMTESSAMTMMQTFGRACRYCRGMTFAYVLVPLYCVDDDDEEHPTSAKERRALESAQMRADEHAHVLKSTMKSFTGKKYIRCFRPRLSLRRKQTRGFALDCPVQKMTTNSLRDRKKMNKTLSNVEHDKGFKLFLVRVKNFTADKAKSYAGIFGNTLSVHQKRLVADKNDNLLMCQRLNRNPRNDKEGDAVSKYIEFLQFNEEKQEGIVNDLDRAAKRRRVSTASTATGSSSTGATSSTIAAFPSDVVCDPADLPDYPISFEKLTRFLTKYCRASCKIYHPEDSDFTLTLRSREAAHRVSIETAENIMGEIFKEKSLGGAYNKAWSALFQTEYYEGFVYMDDGQMFINLDNLVLARGLFKDTHRDIVGKLYHGRSIKSILSKTLLQFMQRCIDSSV